MNIEYFATLFFSFFISMLIHEIGHAISCKYQGGKPNIYLWSFGYVPSLACCCTKTDRYVFFGGYFSFIIFLFFWVITQNNALGVIALLQFFYANYEDCLIGKISSKWYMIGHYILYTIILIPSSIYFGVII